MKMERGALWLHHFVCHTEDLDELDELCQGKKLVDDILYAAMEAKRKDIVVRMILRIGHKADKLYFEPCVEFLHAYGEAHALCLYYKQTARAYSELYLSDAGKICYDALVRYDHARRAAIALVVLQRKRLIPLPKDVVRMIAQRIVHPSCASLPQWSARAKKEYATRVGHYLLIALCVSALCVVVFT